jgi:hypothetical protein
MEVVSFRYAGCRLSYLVSCGDDTVGRWSLLSLQCIYLRTNIISTEYRIHNPSRTQNTLNIAFYFKEWNFAYSIWITYAPFRLFCVDEYFQVKQNFV